MAGPPFLIADSISLITRTLRFYLHKSNVGNERRLTDISTDAKSLEDTVRPLRSHFTSLGNKMEKTWLAATPLTKYIVTGGINHGYYRS
nr:MAG TPA: hypothetical protein [Caudoviricetes sp.]